MAAAAAPDEGADAGGGGGAPTSGVWSSVLGVRDSAPSWQHQSGRRAALGRARTDLRHLLAPAHPAEGRPPHARERKAANGGGALADLDEVGGPAAQVEQGVWRGRASADHSNARR